MCNCSDPDGSGKSRSQKVPKSVAGPTTPPNAPLAAAIEIGSEAAGAEPTLQPVPVPVPPIPPIFPCKLDFREGCYAITYRPTGSIFSFEGTLRVDRSAPDGGPDNIIVSGDLYRRSLIIGPIDPPILVDPVITPGPGPLVPAPTVSPLSASRPSAAAAVSVVDPPLVVLAIPNIPIFPRSRYHSYLKITSVSAPAIVFSPAACQVTLVAEQFDYTHPAAGQHKGSFPATASRTVTIRLKKLPAPFPFSLTGGPYYEGRLFEGGVDKGAVTLAWVSTFFRRATVEVDTLVGAVRPAPVPDGAGGTEFFDTIFAKIGWRLTLINDQVNVPVPAGVTPTNCWSSADLHALMTTVKAASTNVDADWRLHLIVVPAKLGCGRGVMYDSIGVPREACASFSDDGYPTTDSSNFGAAANMKQRDVPRAFLRSATHEITHTFNQIHQEIETASDNSIMTTTPSVANVLGGPVTGAPGVFPDQINLAHNTTVRHHLNHMPDPVIRPGGWPFSSWFPAGNPEATDRLMFDPSELELTVAATRDRVALGEPLELTWTLTNRSASALNVPNDVSTEATFTTVTVTDGRGRLMPVRPFVISCEKARLEALEPGASVSASTKVFWSTEGFAFERPGRHQVRVVVEWSAQGVAVAVANGIDVFVDFPINDSDNRAAGLVMHDDVGKWVALGGGAYHLAEACRRLYELAEAEGSSDEEGPKLLRGFGGLMPERGRLAKLYPEMVGDRQYRRGGKQKATTRTTATRATTPRSRRKR